MNDVLNFFEDGYYIVSIMATGSSAAMIAALTPKLFITIRHWKIMWGDTALKIRLRDSSHSYGSEWSYLVHALSKWVWSRVAPEEQIYP